MTGYRMNLWKIYFLINNNTVECFKQIFFKIDVFNIFLQKKID